MALTPSEMIELCTTAPDFSLPDTEGKTVARDDFQGRPMLVMFICNHCPYVKHVAPELKRLGDDYAGKIGIVAINSNDAKANPDDSPEAMKREKQSRGYTFPYVFDETQKVAKNYGATCTPDFFLYDNEHKLVYRGQLDDTRPNRVSSGNYDTGEKPDGGDLRAAMDAVLAGEKPSEKQKPSVGCNIKWKG